MSKVKLNINEESMNRGTKRDIEEGRDRTKDEDFEPSEFDCSSKIAVTPLVLTAFSLSECPPGRALRLVLPCSDPISTDPI